ncbi:hypothetical protein PFICI_00507 [Pestalotiopsis fici W106-1]|uniref:Major facilitator superfamily (MFS) profile domain-containing protein n=1 Tax=Pestalotiopsis fici (strain W106-1 / CGMCC3.15140) TaxID=1229662 RepID=W3XKZ4_PESFW|nr:uncharacterized protein PFICI_00507 [Pestalotiopsis fici W106-1]ETS86679.1 hypothetical protein PFICI_00507 [Pestalotiopsis fici W106-1]
MRGSRYLRSRQKSCQQCSRAKAKCNRQAGTCSRCALRGLSCYYPQTQPSPEPLQNEREELMVDAVHQQSSPVATNSTNYSVASAHSGITAIDRGLLSEPDTLGSISQPAPSATDHCSPMTATTATLHGTDFDSQSHISGRRSASKISDDFSSLDFRGAALACQLNVDEIASRWLNTFVPIPGQKTKKYPANITAYMRRVLGSYASKAMRGRGAPPFIHPSQIESPAARPPLSTCLSLVRICEKILPGSESAVMDVLQRDMEKVYEQRATHDDISSLSALQAYLLYAIVLFFKVGRAADQTFRSTIINLQELACASSRRGLMCIAEQERARPRWEDWIVAEAKRRTLFAMYIFDNVLSAEEGLPTFIGVELQGLLAPGPKDLWAISSRQEWQIAYNAYLADWPDGGLRIDELWPTPAGFNQPQVDERQRRVDQWLEAVDEYGMMIYVSSRTHIHSSLHYVHKPASRRKRSASDITIYPETLIVLIASTAATFSGFASNIYFPALPTIAHDLDVSVELVNLTVTSYLIFQGLAPSLWGPVSDVKGRRVAYCLTFLVLLGACVGLAEARNYATLIVLRCLQSTGSASTIAIGAGVIGDITTRADRGSYMGIFQAGLLVPTAIGPVIGGALAGSLGWRAIFWFLTIYTGVFLLFLLALLPETLRSIVGNGGQIPSNPIAKFPLTLYQKFIKVEVKAAIIPVAVSPKKIDVLGPLRILTSKFAAPTIIFLAVHYAVWQMSITAMSSLFESRYGLGETQIGLTFIANGVGSMVGTLVSGKILDIDYRRVKAAFEAQPTRSADTEAGQDPSSTGSEENFPLEKARLRLVPIFSVVQCASILLFGWCIQFPNTVPLAIPIISTFITGWSSVSIQSVITTYLVDIFSDRSAAATASLNLARCLFAAGGTSFIMPLINGIGVGLAFTICAIVQVAALLAVSVAWKYAGKWRQQSEQAAKLKNESSGRQ